jgi:hypothetical protein
LPAPVSSVPIFPHLKESAPRQGFVEEKQYSELVKHAPELWLRSLLAVAYTFGFRKSELASSGQQVYSSSQRTGV